MSEMVERVARALYEHGQRSVSWRDWPAWDDPDFIGRAYWRERARVAIEAMRVPTEAMAAAGNDRLETVGWGQVVWDAMIDAALQNR